MFEIMIEEFITKLQWDLRASYNSSSCLNPKQQQFLKEDLQEFVEDIREKITKDILGE